MHGRLLLPSWAEGPPSVLVHTQEARENSGRFLVLQHHIHLHANSTPPPPLCMPTPADDWLLFTHLHLLAKRIAAKPRARRRGCVLTYISSTLPCRPDEAALASASSSESRISRTGTFSSVSVGETARSVQLTELISQSCSSSSLSWSSVEVQVESSSSLQTCSFEVKLGPELLTEMSDVWVKSGERAEFRCLFDGLPFTAVVWDHNGREVAVGTERVASSQTGGLLSLVIQGVGVADQGLYRCTATNRHGLNSSSARLTVEGAPSFCCFCCVRCSSSWSIRLPTTCFSPPPPPLPLYCLMSYCYTVKD